MGGRRSQKAFPHPHFDKPIPDPSEFQPASLAGAPPSIQGQLVAQQRQGSTLLLVYLLNFNASFSYIFFSDAISAFEEILSRRDKGRELHVGEVGHLQVPLQNQAGEHKGKKKILISILGMINDFFVLRLRETVLRWCWSAARSCIRWDISYSQRRGLNR